MKTFNIKAKYKDLNFKAQYKPLAFVKLLNIKERG
jgi:hypothetical protein